MLPSSSISNEHYINIMLYRSPQGGSALDSSVLDKCSYWTIEKSNLMDKELN